MKSMKVVAAAVVLGAGGVLSLQASAVDTFPTVTNTGVLITDSVGPGTVGQTNTVSGGVGGVPGTVNHCTQLQNQSSLFQNRNLHCR